MVLAETLARRIGRYLRRLGSLTQDAENSYLADGLTEGGAVEELTGSLITNHASHCSGATQRSTGESTAEFTSATGGSSSGGGVRREDFRYMPAYPQKRASERSWKGCVAMLAVRRCQKTTSRRHKMDRCATS